MARSAKKAWAAVVVLVLLATPAAFAESTQVNIDYGRSWPLSLAIDSARGVVYLDGESGIYPPTGFSFGIINSTSGALQKVLPLPGEPGELALDESTGTVYVAGATAVNVFDSRTQSFGKQLAVGLPISDVVYDNFSNRLLLTSGGAVYQLDPSTGKVLGSMPVGRSAQGIAVDWVNGEVYVADYLSASVSVLRAGDLSLLKAISLPAPAFPSSLTFDRARNAVYATTDGSSILTIDTKTGSVVRRIDLSSAGIEAASVISLDEKDGLLFVASNPGNSVVEVDATSGAVLAMYPVASTVYEMAFDQATGRLYATNYHQVTVITPSHRTPYTMLLAVVAVVSLALIASLLTFLYSRRFTASGGTRGGPPSQPRTAPSWSPSSARRLPAALRREPGRPRWMKPSP